MLVAASVRAAAGSEASRGQFIAVQVHTDVSDRVWQVRSVGEEALASP